MIKHLVSAALVALFSIACSQKPQHDEHATNAIDPRDERITSLERERDELKTQLSSLSKALNMARSSEQEMREAIDRLAEHDSMVRTHLYLEDSIFRMLTYIQTSLPEECSEAMPDLYQDFYREHPVPSDVDWVEDW